MSERFFLQEPLQPGPVDLTGPEAHHLAAVCRLGPGDQVCLFNGDGREYPARILAVGRKAASLEILSVQRPDRELPFFLEIAVALPKGDRAAFLVEKLTELGVTSFVPLVCQRGVVLPREGKLEKLERHVIEASKQCGRNTLMQVGVPTPSAGYWSRGKSGEVLLLAHPGDTTPLPRPVAGQTYRIAIGPEGGFTDEEVAAGQAAGWRLASLGPRILRVETASLACAAILGAS